MDAKSLSVDLLEVVTRFLDDTCDYRLAEDDAEDLRLEIEDELTVHMLGVMSAMMGGRV